MPTKLTVEIQDVILRSLLSHHNANIFAGAMTPEFSQLIADAQNWVSEQSLEPPPSPVPPELAEHLLSLIRLEGVMESDLSFQANLWLKAELEKQGEEY